MTEAEYRARIKWLEAELLIAAQAIDTLTKNLLAKGEKRK